MERKWEINKNLLNGQSLTSLRQKTFKLKLLQRNVYKVIKEYLKYNSLN